MLAFNIRVSHFGVALLLTVGICVCECSAQTRRYRPSSPTTSNYLNLTRLNTGAIPNYYSLVRPAQRQQEFNRQEQAIRKQQAGSLLRLRNKVQLGLRSATGTGKRSGFMIPSERATFNNSYRYFQTGNSLGR